MRRSVDWPGAFVSLLLASAIAPPIAAAQTGSALVLEPSSAWQASFEEGRCRLSRMFAADSGPHALVLEQRAPGATFHMAIAGPALSGLSESGPVRVAFGPDGFSAEHPIRKDASAEFGTLAFLTDVAIMEEPKPESSETASLGMAGALTAIDTAAAKPLRQIAIAQGEQTLLFATGALAAPFGVLNDCTSHILETWGLDPDAHRKAQRRTEILDGQRVARGINESYPPRAAAEKRQGVVGVAVLVDEAGAPTDCKITHGSGHGDLDGVSCRHLMKARFIPALGADGQPIKSYWMTRIAFRLG